jgi:hypothetical protein
MSRIIPLVNGIGVPEGKFKIIMKSGNNKDLTIGLIEFSSVPPLSSAAVEFLHHPCRPSQTGYQNVRNQCR